MENKIKTAGKTASENVVKFEFEVGKTYRQNGLEFKVLERKGRKVRIEHTKNICIGEIFLKGQIENKTITKVAEGNGLYIEILSWAWGWRRQLGTEVNAEHVVQEEEQQPTKEEVFVEWYEGYYDEWIFCYNAFLKLLLMSYDDGDHTNIRERLDTSADKVVHNIELDEIKDAIVALAEKDADYGMVNIDWTDKGAVKLFIND